MLFNEILLHLLKESPLIMDDLRYTLCYLHVPYTCMVDAEHYERDTPMEEVKSFHVRIDTRKMSMIQHAITFNKKVFHYWTEIFNGKFYEVSRVIFNVEYGNYSSPHNNSIESVIGSIIDDLVDVQNQFNR